MLDSSNSSRGEFTEKLSTLGKQILPPTNAKMVRRVSIGWLGRRDGRSNDPASARPREQRRAWALATNVADRW